MHTELVRNPRDHTRPLALLTQLKDHPDRTFPQLRRVLPRWCHSSSPFQVSEPPTNPGRSTRHPGIPPELEDHTTMAEVIRVPPCILNRRPGEYRQVARFARTLRADDRIQLAGGDYLAQSSTNASVCSGERIARNLLATLRPDPVG
jgi:hypothetical protein